MSAPCAQRLRSPQRRALPLLAAAIFAANLSFGLVGQAYGDDDDALARVNAAVTFWEARSNPSKLAYWQSIRDALTSGDVPDALMAKVDTSWAGARPGGRMYETWKSVHAAFTALREATGVEDVPEEPEEPPTLAVQDDPPLFDFSSLEIPPGEDLTTAHS